MPSPLGLLEKRRDAAQERVDQLEKELARARVVLERRVVTIEELIEALAPEGNASAGPTESNGAETVAVPLKGSKVPVWREDLDPVLALAEDYRRLLAAVEAGGGEGSGLGVRELTVAVGWDPVPSRTENLRSKAKRLAERGWVVADATGSRFMPRPRPTVE
ncbi:hypothetical protein [Streptomyces sp. NPDC002215]|uniref:hypothetical protein n=1 Tax=Streptomyces sp. NPDC002215 TaxID=3154412 RepID=UPI00331C75D3